jgi:hypothetical protein
VDKPQMVLAAGLHGNCGEKQHMQPLYNDQCVYNDVVDSILFGETVYTRARNKCDHITRDMHMSAYMKDRSFGMRCVNLDEDEMACQAPDDLLASWLFRSLYSLFL